MGLTLSIGTNHIRCQSRRLLFLTSKLGGWENFSADIHIELFS